MGDTIAGKLAMEIVINLTSVFFLNSGITFYEQGSLETVDKNCKTNILHFPLSKQILRKCALICPNNQDLKNSPCHLRTE